MKLYFVFHNNDDDNDDDDDDDGDGDDDDDIFIKREPLTIMAYSSARCTESKFNTKVETPQEDYDNSDYKQSFLGTSIAYRFLGTQLINSIGL